LTKNSDRDLTNRTHLGCTDLPRNWNSKDERSISYRPSNEVLGSETKKPRLDYLQSTMYLKDQYSQPVKMPNKDS